MGRDFASTFTAAAAAFEEASDALGIDMKALCFERDPRLNLTEFTQPALVTTEIAMFRALTQEYGLAPALLAGHSLGEYSALVAAGVMPLGQAARLVRERGRLLQAAVPPGEGSMMAIMHPRLDRVALRACLVDLEVDVANDNAPGQVVLSGLEAAMATALDRLRNNSALSGVQVRKLNVSAPFHCRLMAVAEAPLRALLEQAAPGWDVAGASRVFANVSAELHLSNRNAVVDRLVRQVSAPVRWTETMMAIDRMGACPTVEIGPTATLCGLFKFAGMRVHAVTDVASARCLFQPVVVEHRL
jgi:[acyl-carrier-protein] S-malonyltransferase/trans-AT polyketide synthase/acyltransferase/oxidoreductase domain-containing protein